MSTVTLVLFAAALVIGGAAFLRATGHPEPQRMPVRRLPAPRDRRLP